MLFERAHVAGLLSRLAREHRVYLGTVSWRFPGWCGMLYDEENYLWGTHFSKKRFSDHCLEEYAAVFRSVEVDSTYYALPRMDFLEGIARQAPAEFVFSFKVPDDITIKTFPKVATFGDRAGKTNEFFLDAGLFNMGFLRRLEPMRERVGALIFEFSHFHAEDFAHGRDFVADLDRFFAEIPRGWHYAVEIRNRAWLHPEYFAMLARHGVGHVYNQWTRMPAVSEQLELHPAAENARVVARYLLAPGRTLEGARAQFEPFHQVREIDPGARQSLTGLIRRAIAVEAGAQPHFIYVGNEMEGNALHTIADVLEEVYGGGE